MIYHHTVARSNDQLAINCTRTFATSVVGNFSQWILNDWNSLPREIIESENVAI